MEQSNSLFKCAAIQMNSSADITDNLARCAQLIKQAAAQQAKLIVLPETFAFMGKSLKEQIAIAETLGRGPIQDFLAQQAHQHQVWLVGGTVPIKNQRAQQVYATCLLLNARGERVAAYNKIHLFDVDLPDQNESYRESNVFQSGHDVVCADTPLGCIGLSVCYDLRFPELFRMLIAKNAEIIVLPSAFTKHTGEAHWRLLLRARAVENQAWVIGANQAGVHANGRSTYGHSAIVEPWGKVVAEAQSDAEQVIVAEINRDKQAELRTRFPCIEHRNIALSLQHYT